jgi:predicted metal-dependent HD superfamily phosphohydrolase
MRPATDDVPRQLEAAWRRLLRPFHVPEPAVTAAFADLVARYSEASRHYHNLTHLAEMLTIIDDLADEATAVRLAAWFHDAVYYSRAQDNEERSTALAGTVLGNFGLPHALIADVERLVLLTKTHLADGADRDAQLLLDADLAILGAQDDRYDDYARAIRREYAWVADDAYRDGRGRVLKGFLKRPRIYFTDALFRSHEARARRNLRRELDLLRAPPG